MSGFWAEGFWSAGFWSEGFWGGVQAEALEERYGGRGRRKPRDDNLTAEEVQAQWELLELRRQAATPPVPPQGHGDMARGHVAQPIDEIGATAAAEAAGAAAALTLPMPEALRPAPAILSPLHSATDAVLPITIEQQRAALDAKRRQDAAALVLLLSEL